MSDLLTSSWSQSQSLIVNVGKHVRETIMRQEKYAILRNPWFNVGFAGLGTLWALNRLLSKAAEDKWLLNPYVNEWQWQKEVAVVTGGSNGMGALVTKGLADKGVNVAVVDIMPLAEDANKNPNIHFFQCDITEPDAVKKTATTIKSKLGAPSILCNNAGIAHAHTVLDATPEYLRKLFDVNLLSHFSLLQAFLPDMIAQRKGHIVTTASMASFATAAGLVDYCASKAGALALHEGLTQELKHRYDAPEIKTSVVHPTYVRTKLIMSYEESLQDSRAVVITPETVANAIVDQILSGRSGQIILPSWMSAASGARGWPTWLQELLRDSLRKDVTSEVRPEHVAPPVRTARRPLRWLAANPIETGLLALFCFELSYGIMRQSIGD